MAQQDPAVVQETATSPDEGTACGVQVAPESVVDAIQSAPTAVQSWTLEHETPVRAAPVEPGSPAKSACSFHDEPPSAEPHTAGCTVPFAWLTPTTKQSASVAQVMPWMVQLEHGLTADQLLPPSVVVSTPLAPSTAQQCC
jgi:hypothetical protein